MSKITMKVLQGSFKRIDDPFNKNSKKYYMYVKIDDVSPNIPMATNPRDQKLSSNVATKIDNSVISKNKLFHLLNRGIVVSAAKVYYNNKTGEVTIYCDDEEKHGNLDGGHTYKIIKKYIGKNLEQYVQFEIITGIEDDIVEVAESRNTSTQVDEKSLAELLKKFDPIKEGVEGLSFYNRIAFKQNQLEVVIDQTTGKETKSKMIDAREIVAILMMFDIHEYSKDNHPIQAYSSKATMLKKYLENPDHYRKFINIMPDIFDLYDMIETEFADAFNSTGKRYGARTYSGYNDKAVIAKSKFSENEMVYKVPDGIIYPLVAAFRALVNYDDTKQQYGFIKRPEVVWGEVKQQLALNLMALADATGDSPNKIGKEATIWNMMYMIVAMNITLSLK